MTYYAGIDVSLETSTICIVYAQGTIRRELKAESEPEAIAAALIGTGLAFSRIGLEQAAVAVVPCGFCQGGHAGRARRNAATARHGEVHAGQGRPE